MSKIAGRSRMSLILPTAAALLAFSTAAFAQAPTVTAVVNASSFSTLLCPGLFVTIYGTNFGTNAAVVSVNVGGKAAYLYPTIFGSQMNAQIPFEASTGPTTLTVTVGGVQSASSPITLGAVSPYFVTADGSGTGLAAVYQLSGTLVTAAAPAHAGDVLTVNAVGLGPTNPATPTTANGLAPA